MATVEPVAPTPEAITTRKRDLDAEIASQRGYLENEVSNWLNNQYSHRKVQDSYPYGSGLLLHGHEVDGHAHTGKMGEDYYYFHVRAMLGDYRWIPLLMRDKTTRNVVSWFGSDAWNGVLDDALAHTVVDQEECMRAYAWFYNELGKADGSIPFDYAAVAAGKHVSEHIIYAREQVWAGLMRFRRMDTDARYRELDRHRDFRFPFEDTLEYKKFQALNEIAAAVAGRHEALVGSWLPKTKFIAGSSATQETALRALSRAYQLAVVKVHKADATSLPGILEERLTTVRAVNATGRPEFRRSDGTKYAPAHNILAHHYEWIGKGDTAARDKIMDIVAASPDASDECAIMEVENGNAEIEAAVSIPSDGRQHKVTLYWVANAALVAGKVYSVTVKARNEIGDSIVRVDVTSPVPDTP